MRESVCNFTKVWSEKIHHLDRSYCGCVAFFFLSQFVFFRFLYIFLFIKDMR